MQYIEYIQNGTGTSLTTGWHIPLNYKPTSKTNVMMRCKIDTNDYFNGDIFIGAKGGNGNFFRFFGHQTYQMTFDCPNDSSGRIYTRYTGTTEWEVSCVNSVLTLKNLTANLTTTASTNLNITWNEDWCVWNDRVTNGNKVYYIEVYEDGVKVKDFRPAKDNNDVVCLYETINHTYHYNEGNTLIGGPSLSSISVSPSFANIKATGGTVSIEVTCENAWTLSTSGDSFLTFSSTGDTGGTTITATAPSYTGATNMLEYITFTDSVTGDIAEMTIKQKKYQSGQPLYLGADEITELFLGGDSIAEAYLGEDLVYSSGPFQGLKLNPKSLSFNIESLTGSLKIKSSEQWEITSLPAWLTASSLSGNSGETIVSFSATTQSANTQGNIVVTTANYSASAVASFYVVQFLDYIHSQTMTNHSEEYLVTSIYPTLATKGEFKFQYKGYNTNNILVGMYGNESGWDNRDWRLFTFQYRYNFDLGSGRIASELGGYSIMGADYDISFGNNYITNNDNGVSVTGATSSTALDNLPIKVCMGVVWVKEVKLWQGETLVFDGKAAKMGDSYGLFDTVGGEFITDPSLNLVGECGDECQCVSNGGQWIGGECVYPSPTGGGVSVSVAYAADGPASANTYYLYSTDHMTGDLDEHHYILATATIVKDENQETYMTASAITDTGITSVVWDNDNSNLIFTGEFDTGYTYAVRYQGLDATDNKWYYGNCYDENSGDDTFTGDTNVSFVLPDFTDTGEFVKQLIITGFTGSDEQVYDYDGKFDFSIDDMGEEMVSFYECDDEDVVFPPCPFSCIYDDTAHTLTVVAKWEEDISYFIISKSPTDAGCVQYVNEISWSEGNYTVTMGYGDGDEEPIDGCEPEE